MEYVALRVCNRRTMNDFLRLPDLIYRGDPAWTPPLRSEVRRTLDVGKNPYFANASLELFVCYEKRRPVARTIVVINRMHQEKFRMQSAFFGFFESFNIPEAVHSLFGAVEAYCRSHEVEVLEGPFNPNHYSELGLQVDRFEVPPTFFQTHNPPYYSTLVEGEGFQIAKTLLTAKNDHICEYIRRIGPVTPPATGEQEYTVRHVDETRLAQDLEAIRVVFNDAFTDNWHFLPASREEYRFSTKFLRYVTDPNLIALVEHRGHPVGVLMCVLDINPLLKSIGGRLNPLSFLRFLRGKRHVKRLIVYAVGIRRAYQRTRVFKLLLDEMCAMAAGYDALETTWMSPDNPLAVRAAARLGMTPDKHFAIYQKRLTAA